MIVLVSARIVLLSCIIYVAAGWLSGIKMSRRIMKTESPYIEDVLERYCSIPDLTMLALGSVYWNPPEKSIAKILTEISDKQVHKYGSILGDEALRSHLSSILGLKGLDMSSMDLAITAGANQAFSNAALAVCDEGDHAVILAPYYFSHKLSLQLCGAQVHVCPFDPATLAPDWDALEAHVAKHKPKMVYSVF